MQTVQQLSGNMRTYFSVGVTQHPDKPSTMGKFRLINSVLFRFEAVHRPIFALANGLQKDRIHTEQELGVDLGVTKRNNHCATIVAQRTVPCNRTQR